MKLKRLEAVGFKSFGERMEFDFGSGLTGIVGPNGCGKSNVVDAVRWVMGEMRPTQLRGGEMLDVIFKGASGRSAAGFAEVTVVLDNEGGGLPSEFSEVSFTRRLFRTGESEYLINRRPARLKDIRELLLDTGLGVHSYTILEQGKIDAVLSANPVERRGLFEEAAGISKFKLRRKEAHRKMEHVQQNLLRVSDLLAELESGIRSLKLQATKARKYKEYTERHREIKVNYSLHQYRGMTGELETARHQRQGLDQEVATRRTRREEIEKEKGLLEEELGILEAELSREVEALESVKAEEAKAAERISSLEVRLSEWEREKKTAQDRRESQKKILDEKRGEGEGLLGELEKVREKLAVLQRDLETREESSKEVSQEFRRVTARLKELDQEVTELMHQRTEAKNESVDRDGLLKTMRAERDRLETRKSQLEGEVGEKTRLEREQAGESEVFASREQELEDRLAELRTRRADSETEYKEKDQQAGSVAERISALESKYQLLKELAETREGLDRGAQSLLEEGEGISLFADHVQVELKYSRALETALASKASAVVVLDKEKALGMVQRLSREKKGRATIALPGNLPVTSTLPEIPQVPGIWGRLLDQVRADDSIKPLLERWIGDCLLVESADRAKSLAERHPDFRFLTIDGNCFSADTWIGGEESRETGLISRRSLIEALETELQALRADRDLFALAKGELERTIEQLRREEEEAVAQKEEVTRQAAGVRAALEQLQKNLRKSSEELGLVQGDLRALGQEISKAETAAGEFTSQLEELQKKFHAANEELKRLHADKAAREHQKEDAFRLESEQRLEVEKFRGAEKTLLGQRELLAEAISDLEREIDQLGRTVAEIEDRTAKAHEEIETLHASRTAGLEKRGSLEDKLKGLRGRRDGLNQNIATRRGELDSQSGEFEALLSQQGEARLAEQKVEMQREEISNRIREEFQLELAQLVHEREPEEGFQEKEIAEEIEELRRKIGRLGTINLDAMRELEEKEERHKFLSEQKGDLDKSRRLLLDTIRKIDEESRARFTETFEKAREEFQVIFRQLFRGGKADLELEEGADLLDAGVTILARPPGKELRNIDLLSGGERTLTALALLFSLFKLKPSPFCVLDEVDAALDDANIERFLGVLTEFTKGSQFIIVTHNKRTMMACGLLYGITMQDNGVSKKVGVELSDGEEVRLVSQEKTYLLPRPEEKKEEKTAEPESTPDSAVVGEEES